MSILSRITDWVATPYTIYLILRDPSMSRAVKVRSFIGVALLFAYAVSPVDIVPDFIPLSGWIDDLVVVPLGLILLRKFIPDIGIMERRDRLQTSVSEVLRKVIISLAIAAVLFLVWAVIFIYIVIRANS